jgi:hypothetical protein
MMHGNIYINPYILLPHVAKGHVFKGKRKRILKEQLKHLKWIVDKWFEEKIKKEVERGTSTKHTVPGSIKIPKGKACHSSGQVKAKWRESKINLESFWWLALQGAGCWSWCIPLIVCRSIGLTGVGWGGVAGGGARAPSIGAAVTKEAVNICPGVYPGMLAPWSRFEAACMQMNVSA